MKERLKIDAGWNGPFACASGSEEPEAVLQNGESTMPRSRNGAGLWFVVLVLLLPLVSRAAERTERFDRDPGWEGHNNRIASGMKPRPVKQDFGYSTTSHAGGQPGEIGGYITPAAEAAYYARKIRPRTFADPLTASGTLACTGREFHVLIGFFNANTLNEWRTPNTVALRISGRGDVFYAWVEYATSRWRAGGDHPRGFTEADPKGGRPQQRSFASKGAVHRWSLRYDPAGNDGRGVITASIGDVTAVCHLTEGHKDDGATFNRFGLLNVMKSIDGGGEVWLDNLVINGQQEDFATDPGWEGFHNRHSYESSNVRPQFDFGFSPTHHAGGQGAGELGGIVFRGDCRYPARLACYGDRLSELTLDKPLRAAGRISLRRGVTDSTVLLGFYHATDSMSVNSSQAMGLPNNFLGLTVGGPSRAGFLVTPGYRVGSDSREARAEDQPPVVYPDGVSHAWSLSYDPAAAEGRGKLLLAVDGKAVGLELGTSVRKAGGRFNRFGLVTTWVDGNAQHIYFDDLTYTWQQE